MGAKPAFSFRGPKPVDTKGTAAAFAAGSRVFKRTGVTPALKNVVKLSLDNDKKAGRVRRNLGVGGDNVQATR